MRSLELTDKALPETPDGQPFRRAAFKTINTQNKKKRQARPALFEFPKISIQRWSLRRYEFCEARILAYLGKLGILVDVLKIFVPFFLRFL
jgi:hypothetical protein